MNIKKIEKENYNYYYINENRFKRNTLVFSYRMKSTKNSYLVINLLLALIGSTSKKYNTYRKAEIKEKELYSPSFRIKYNKTKKHDCIKFIFSFLDESYTEKGMNNKSINYFLDRIYNPNIINDKFDNIIFERERKEFIKYIKSLSDNTSCVINDKFDSLIGKGTSLGQTLINKDREVSNLKNEFLVSFYNSFICNSDLDICYIGRNDLNISKFDRYLSNRKQLMLPKDTCEFLKENKKLLELEETVNNNQSTLWIKGYFKNLTEYESYYVLPIFNYIFGENSDSKLFLNVREKNSLCYTIYSSTSRYFNSIKIYAGINAHNKKKTIELILRELDNIKKGKFNNNDIKNAITSYVTTFKEYKNSESSMLNVFYNNLYNNTPFPEERIEQISMVKKEDIVNVANKIIIDTIYFFKGELKDENN